MASQRCGFRGVVVDGLGDRAGIGSRGIRNGGLREGARSRGGEKG